MKVDISKELPELIESATLQDIHIKDMNVSCKVPPTSIVASETALDHTKSTDYLLSEDGSFLIGFISFETKGRESSDENGKVYFELSIVYAVVYSLEKTGFSKETVQVFTDKNIFFNAYPYIRESFQSISQKMGLPSVVLPLLKPPTKKELKKELSKQSSSEKH